VSGVKCQGSGPSGGGGREQRVEIGKWKVGGRRWGLASQTRAPCGDAICDVPSARLPFASAQGPFRMLRDAARTLAWARNEGATVLDVKKQDPVSKVDCGGSWH
jgi:hypothetical protein